MHGSIELPRPELSEPALLVLGPHDSSFSDLASLCQSAGIRVDRAETTKSALEAFLVRGGHDAVLCHGAMHSGEAHDSLVNMLRCIDSTLEIWDLEHVRTLAHA